MGMSAVEMIACFSESSASWSYNSDPVENVSASSVVCVSAVDWRLNVCSFSVAVISSVCSNSYKRPSRHSFIHLLFGGLILVKFHLLVSFLGLKSMLGKR